MAKKPATNKLWEPFSYVPPGACPKCGEPTMGMIERDSIYYLLDEDGVPTLPYCTTVKGFTCIKCGFSTTDYICTDKGYRYNPYDQGEFIKEINRIPRSDTMVDRNPLVKEKSKDGRTR